MRTIQLTDIQQAEQFLRPPEANAILAGMGGSSDGKYVRNLVNIHIPKEGGVFMEYEGVPHFEVGFPFWDTVKALEQTKKSAALALEAFRRTLSTGKIKAVILLLFFRKQLKAIMFDVVSLSYRQLKPYQMYDLRYCKMVKEIKRVFETIKPEDKEMRFIWERTKVLVMLFMEFDSAYRYRTQYILGKLDKIAFEKKPFVELVRLCRMAFIREGDNHVRRMWSAIWWAVLFARFIPRWRRMIIQFIKELNIDEIKFTEADRYFAIEKYKNSPSPEFNFTDEIMWAVINTKRT